MLTTSRRPAAFTHHLRKSCRFAMILPYPSHKPPLALPLLARLSPLGISCSAVAFQCKVRLLSSLALIACHIVADVLRIMQGYRYGMSTVAMKKKTAQLRAMQSHSLAS